MERNAYSTTLSLPPPHPSYHPVLPINPYLPPPCPSNSHLSVFSPFLEAVIKFGETKFSVTEPSGPGESVVVKIPVIRQGDTSKVSIVRVHTKDGSAASGEDYHPVSEGMGLPVTSWVKGSWWDLGM